MIYLFNYKLFIKLIRTNFIINFLLTHKWVIVVVQIKKIKKMIKIKNCNNH